MRPLEVINEETEMVVDPRQPSPHSSRPFRHRMWHASDGSDSHQRSSSAPRGAQPLNISPRRSQERRSQQGMGTPPVHATVVAAAFERFPAYAASDTHRTSAFDVNTAPATRAATPHPERHRSPTPDEGRKNAPAASVWSRLRSSLSRSDVPHTSRRSRSSRSTRSSRRRYNGAFDEAAVGLRASGGCPCCGAKENHVPHLGQERTMIFDANVGPVCPTCQRKRELAAWRKLSDWRANIRANDHYQKVIVCQYECVNNRPRSSHLPEGWEMMLYVPNPAVEKDVLDVLEEGSIDALPILHAVRPSGDSVFSYFSPHPLVLWEQVPPDAGGSGDVRPSDRRRILAYIHYSRTPFLVLRVENNQVSA